jgi:hypothetical protein
VELAAGGPVLLVAAYWRMNVPCADSARLFGGSKSAAAHIIDHLGPKLGLQQRKGFRKGAVPMVDGTWSPPGKDHTVAKQSKNYRYATSHQAVIDADTRLVDASADL